LIRKVFVSITELEIMEINRVYTISILLCLLLAISTNATADLNRYALLVGVGNYPVKPLAGPVNDVKAVHKALTNYWGFKSRDITVLLNLQATKSNILTNIEKLYSQSKPGDEVFIYFSGHGTSASDVRLSAPLPSKTGAFIPVDIANVTSIKDLIDHLVVGKEDLRPLFSKLDSGNRNVFVAMDACFSGNTVRGKYADQRPPSRYLSLSDIFHGVSNKTHTTAQSFGKDDSYMGNKVWINTDNNQNNDYPYKNIFYLSASGEHEPAQDIPQSMLSQYPTVDSKPHGAFTDSLLRILNNYIDTDINKDGSITYAELKKTIRNVMRERGFNHTPQGLPTLSQDRSGILDKSLFGYTGLPQTQHARLEITTQHTQVDKSIKKASTSQSLVVQESSQLSIRLDPEIDFLREFLIKQRSLNIVKRREDIYIKHYNSEIILLSGAGDIITGLKDFNKVDLIKVLNSQHWLKNYLNREYPEDYFLELEYYNPGLGSTFIEGDLVGFTIRSSVDSYLLLIDIDPNGVVSVIFPYDESELKKYPAKSSIVLKNISKVRAPFGKDTIQLYAFNELPDKMEVLIGKRFDIESPLMKIFESLIYDPRLSKSRASLALITSARVQ